MQSDVYDAFRVVNKKLNAIMRALDVVMQQEANEMATMDALLEKVHRQTTVTEGVLVYLADLKDKLANAGVSDEVLAEIDANTDKLAAAIVANTPAADEAAQEPAPAE